MPDGLKYLSMWAIISNPDEEIRDGGLDVVVDNLLPPSAGDGIGICREEDLGVETGAEWRVTKSGVDDLLGFDPRIFVGDIPEPKI